MRIEEPTCHGQGTTEVIFSGRYVERWEALYLWQWIPLVLDQPSDLYRNVETA